MRCSPPADRIDARESFPSQDSTVTKRQQIVNSPAHSPWATIPRRI
jgi:hypothetical protein